MCSGKSCRVESEGHAWHSDGIRISLIPLSIEGQMGRQWMRFVWPIKCHIESVIATVNIEKTSPAQWDTSGTAAAQGSGGVAQAFSDTLLAVSKATSESDSVNDGSTGAARRKKPEDAQAPSAASDGNAFLSQMNSQQTVLVQQTAPMQQAHVAKSISSTPDTTFGGVIAAQDASTAAAAQLTGNQSNVAQPVTGSFQIASASTEALDLRTNSPIVPLSQTQNRASGAVAGVVANTAQDSIPAPVLNAGPKMSTTIDAIPAVHAAMDAPAVGAQPVIAQPSVIQPESGSSQAESILRGTGDQRANTPIESLSQSWNGVSTEGANGVQVLPANAVSDATATGAARTDADRASNPAPSGVADPTVNSLSKAVVNGVSNTVVNADSAPLPQPAVNVGGVNKQAVDDQASISPAESGFSQTASKLPEAGSLSTDKPIETLSHSGKNISDADVNKAPVTSTNELQVPDSNAAHHATAKAGDTDADTAPSQAPSVLTNAAQNSIPSAVLAALNAVVSAEGAPVLHASLNASTKGALPAASKGSLGDQAVPAAIAPNQSVSATSVGFADGTASQFVAVNQPGAGLPGMAKAGVSSLSSTSATKPSSNSVTNGKDTVSDASGVKQHTQSASDQTGSQSASTSGDQSQSIPSSQGVNAPPVQMNFATHTVAATIPVQNTVVVSPAPGAPAHAGISGSANETADRAVTVSSATPQAQPIINSAKLIQSMGQSEMRVGMRSNEFGNISISTSTTRDSISAQISLDHGELAKELTAHLPEMQARLGGDQAVNVRIDMNGGMAGQGTATSGGMSNGSSEQSRGGRHQSSDAASSYASNNMAERQLSSATAAATTGYGRLNARLDIRV